MKVAILGASGFVGSFILAEALRRGHKVTAVIRHPEEISQHPNLAVKQGNILDEDSLALLISECEAVISAFGPGTSNPDFREIQMKGTTAIINGVKKAGISRLLMVGGAGSLEVAPGIQLVDTDEYPSEWKTAGTSTREVLNLLLNEHELEWTFLSPSLYLSPGERTGKFSLGNDQLIRNSIGESKISSEDYAVAMIDELEKPKHIRKRFTVGYT